MEKSGDTAKRYRLGACLPVFGSCADRYCLSGYGRGATTLEGMLDLAAQCPGLEGVELVGNWHVNDEPIGRMPPCRRAFAWPLPRGCDPRWSGGAGGEGRQVAP